MKIALQVQKSEPSTKDSVGYMKKNYIFLDFMQIHAMNVVVVVVIVEEDLHTSV